MRIAALTYGIHGIRAVTPVYARLVRSTFDTAPNAMTGVHSVKFG